MAFQESTSVAGAPEAIDIICTFAAANGWTVERNNLVGALRTATLRIPGVTDYIHLYNLDAVTLRHRISVGYDGGLAPSAQPDVSPTDGTCDLRVGPIPKIHAFATGNVIHVAFNISIAATWRFLSFGLMDKLGTYDGGTYCDASYFPDGNEGISFAQHHVLLGAGREQNSGFVRADCVADSRANFFHAFGDIAINGDNALTGQRGARTNWPKGSGAGNGERGRLIMGADDNTFSGRSVFQPIDVYVRRLGVPSYYSPAGQVPGIRFASLAKFDVEQEVTIGGDVWKMYPVVRKGPEGGVLAGGNARSGIYGYAVLKS